MVLVIPRIVTWIPYDYAIYVEGARMVRDGMNPHTTLPYWYPLPIVLFTTLPWSFLPDQFAWAFAFIPLGLLHLRFGRCTYLWWLFFPLLIGVAFAQAEAWLVWPLFWLLEDTPFKASVGTVALMFKPAYGMFIVPYRIWLWLKRRRWRELGLLCGLSGFMMTAAFLVDREWPLHWLSAALRRGENRELVQRNMTIWAFGNRGSLWLIPLALLLVAFVLLAIPLARSDEGRSAVLLALSLFVFPNGLNPVSSMMVMPLARSMKEILILVAASWIVAGLDAFVGGFGGVYLIIVLVGLALVTRRTVKSPAGVTLCHRPVE